MPGFRVTGPERHRRKWRVRVYSPDGRCRSRGFDERAEADEYAAAVRAELDAKRALEEAAEAQRAAEDALARALAIQGERMSVRDAIDRYEQAMRDRGNEVGSITTALYRLRALCGPVLDEPIAGVTAPRAEELYRDRVATGVSAGTHRPELQAARALWAWAGRQGWAPLDPWRDVEAVGKIPRGKEQLRVDEARSFDETLMRALSGYDVADQERALGAAMALYLGMRAGEIVTKQVRDVTRDGGLVEIDKAKTRAGDRRVEVPEELQRALAAARSRAMARGGTRARILPFRPGWVRDQVHRFCKRAGVPLVCAHALRGMNGSFSRMAGVSGKAVAEFLGHASESVTKAHYTTPAAEAEAKTRAALRVLKGGKER